MFPARSHGGARNSRLMFAIIGVLLLSATPAVAGQDCVVGWGTPALPPSRYGHAVASDSNRGVLVVFGGRQTNTSPLLGDTWEFDGTRWNQTAISGPSPREQFAMAYHAGIGKVVLVGGLTADGDRNDVWTYDSGGWTQLADAPFPPRHGHAAAYDAVRDRMVMHGGSQLDNITWLFDGATWSSFTAGGPGARTGAAMAFDPIRRRVVLFGSDQVSEPVGRVHEWNGAGWFRTDPPGPNPRGGAAMAFDPATSRVVLFGGSVNAGSLTFQSDTWTWDGNAWQFVTNLGPTPRWRSQAAYHPQRGIMLFGGALSTLTSGNLTAANDEWRLDPATGWLSADALPEGRNSASLGYDELRDELVLFGGIDQTPSNSLNDQTWIRRDGAWQLRGSGSTPGARSNAALGYNPLTQTVFMVGGFGPSALQQTWSWDGRSWTQLTANGPSATSGHVTLFDPISQRMLLLRADVPVEFWNGTQWQVLDQVTTPPTLVSNAFLDRARDRIVIASPSGMHEWTGSAWNRIGDGIVATRTQRNIAYDDVRGVAVVWAGPPCGQTGCGTWEWNGTTWTQFTAAGPTAIDLFSMAFDAERERVVLFGGRDPQSPGLDAAWEWDGATWTPAPRRRPPPLADHAIVVDRRRGDVLIFGGRTSDAPASATRDTWVLTDGAWRRHVSSNPLLTPRFNTSLAYDEKRDVVVMVNGQGTTGAGLREVWEWNGEDWTMRWNGSTFGPPANPIPVIYDPIRQRVVMHAGPLFAWNGTNWTMESVTGAVPPTDAVPTVDTDRGVIVAITSSATLFELFGNRWTIPDSEQPQPRPGSMQPGFSFHYDPSRRVCVLIGRENNLPPNQPQQTWEWDGSAWTRRTDAILPSTRTAHAATFDGRTGRVLLHGGANINTQPDILFSDFWALGSAAAVEIVTEPDAVDAQRGDTIELFCAATATNALSYQWRFRGGLIDDGATFAGTTTPTLTINDLSGFEEGGYDCVISDGCATVITACAVVNVIGTCIGDVSGDGRVDLVDIATVLRVFGRDGVPPNFPSDVDRDGAVGLADLAYVLRNFGVTCE